MPPRLFYSYSRRDERYREDLETHLKNLARSGVISHWHERMIVPGADREEEIRAQLEQADIILLLVSADFLASDFACGNAMDVALRRHQQRQAAVVPVLIRPVDLADAPFAGMQMLPRDERPVSTWPNPDEAWLDVVRGIRRVAAEITRARAVDDGSATAAGRQEDPRTPGRQGEGGAPFLEPLDSCELFSHRMSDAFPGLRVVQEFTPAEGCDRLEILLRSPLTYANGTAPFWWFGHGNDGIERFQRLGPERILLFPHELQVARVVAVRAFSDEWRDFVYLEAAADQPVDADPRPTLDRGQAAARTHSAPVTQEFAVWRGRPISREEYDDGAAIIDGKPTPVPGAEPRIRYLTPANVIVCGKKHVVNQLEADRPIRAVLTGILRGERTIDDLVAVVGGLELPPAYHDQRVW